MRIGNIEIDSRVVLAPMAGVTDYPFRRIAASMGCRFLYTEMVSSKGLIYGNKRTDELIDFAPEREHIITVQIFGNQVQEMAEAARIIESKYDPDIIDINMGCPTPKIVGNGSGAALMKDPGLAGEIIAGVVEAVKLPVTVKMRKGWDENHINAVSLAERAGEMGAEAVAVHGRTRSQFYSGRADWDIIKQVVESVTIPVLGNGDVFTPQAAEAMLAETDCDGIMIGRGVRGNPWLLKRCNHYLQTGELLPEPGYETRITMALKHLELAVDYYGSATGVPLMRKHIGWYLKGLPYSTGVKDKINSLKSPAEVRDVLHRYLAKLQEKSV